MSELECIPFSAKHSSSSPNPKKRKYRHEEPSSKKSSKEYRELEFESVEAAAKYATMKRNMISGYFIDFKGYHNVLAMLNSCKLDVLVVADHPLVHHELVGEFYCNLMEQVNKSGLVYFITSVNGRPMLIDDELIRKVLNYPSNYLQTCTDLAPVSFNRKDFHAYIKVLCDCDSIPSGMFDSEQLVSSDHFCPEAQLLALIFRHNIMPKIPLGPHDKWFNFFDLKFLHDIMTYKLKVNLPYLIVSQMVKASKIGYFAYGMFLDKVFKHFDINLLSHASISVSSWLSVKSVKFPIPLTEFLPYNHKQSKKSAFKTQKELEAQKMKEVDKTFDEIKVVQVLIQNELVNLTSRIDAMDKTLAEFDKKIQQQKNEESLALVVHNSVESVKGKEVKNEDAYMVDMTDSAPVALAIEMFMDNSQQNVDGSASMNELNHNLDFMSYS